MANEQNLIPITSRPAAEIKAMAKKGGLVCSDNKKLAARLRELKKKGLTDSTARVLGGMMDDNKLYGLEILRFLTRWITECKSPGQAAMLGNTLINLQKSIHGEIIKTESTTININFEADMEKYNELKKKYDKESAIETEAKEK